MRRTLAIGMLLTAFSPGVVSAAETPHPFILWNKEDVAAIRAKIEQHAWARAELERLKNWSGHGSVHRNLFLSLVEGDEKAGQVEKEYLLSFIGAPVDSRPWSDNYLSALRYDVLYDQLAVTERKQIEDTFRVHIRHEIDNDRKEYTRTSWLPNMQWPRKNGAMLMAVAMADETLIREIFAGNGGWKWYFDEYISDGYFYNEEFGKHYSNIGEMLLWCRGLERLGLDELGYGYVGKGASGGATMRKYLESIHLVGYPCVDLGSNRPHYPKMTMGDAKGKRSFHSYAFQHHIVQGMLANGIGGNRVWMGSNMNGRDHKNRVIEKMEEPLWFEIAHAKWPDAHFDYFLAQMRGPDQDRYYPSLYWGLDPIDPSTATPPPAPSAAYRQRGIAVLRFNETPQYWRSPEPAVTMRFATPYVHQVPDCFAIIGYYAFNRPIYLNRQVSAGYAGTDPGWSSSIRSHASVQVDGGEPERVGELPHRFDSNKLAKFVAVRGQEVYPGVDQTRALILTREYLFDVFALTSDRPRLYQWATHTLGRACPDNPHQWAATRHLVGTIYDVFDERSCVTNRTWSITSTQYTAGAHPDLSGLGKSWFDPKRRVGVRMTMLGEPGTIAYHGLGPAYGGASERIYHGAIEPGGVTIAAARSTPSTAFVALHEPFQGQAGIGGFREVARTDDAAVVEIGGPGQPVHDWAMVRWGESADETTTLTGAGAAFRFRNYALVRKTAEGFHAVGQLESFTIDAGDVKPKLILNGKTAPIELRDGMIGFGRNSLAARPRPNGNSVSRAAPLSLWWSTDVVRLPTGATGQAVLHVRNLATPRKGDEANDSASISGRLRFIAPAGIRVKPTTLELRDFAPGEERSVTVRVSAEPDAAAALSEIRLAAETSTPVALQSAPLRISHGVNSERTQIWPRDFAMTVYAPRYIMKFSYWDNTAAALIRDPLGLRRTEGGKFRPALLEGHPDDRGRMKWTEVPTHGFQAFRPVPRIENDGERFLADMGQHPHGYNSPFEWRFYEDWVIVRLRKPSTERVVLDFSPDKRFANPGVDPDVAKEKMPGIALFAVGDRLVSETPKKGEQVVAAFSRWSGFEYGQATFYPPGSEVADRGRVAQPSTAPMAFTFCTEEEFPAFVRRWKKLSELVHVKPWGQGDQGL